MVIKTLVVIFMLSQSWSKQIRGFPPTPKAADLQDHFGTEPVQNLYGPTNRVTIAHIAREGVTGEATPISPITNFGKEIDPVQVVAGDLDNTSYDASKIIKAPYAGKIFNNLDPKFNIKSTIVHEAVVKTPVHMGTQYEERASQSMNRVTGQVTKKTVTVEKPIIGIMNNVRQVQSNQETLVNINTGRIIDVTKKAELHGTNPI